MTVEMSDTENTLEFPAIQLLTIVRGLALEIKNPGMRMTRYNMCLRAAKRIISQCGYTPPRTRKKVLDFLFELFDFSFAGLNSPADL